jgi:hypothetical protein
MARINQYPLDNDVNGQDKLLGTDVTTGDTKNFPVSSIANFFNKAGSIGIARQHNVMFQTDLTDGRSKGTISFAAGSGDATTMTDITTLMLSKHSATDQNSAELLAHLGTGTVIISNLSNPNIFCEYTVDSLVEDSTDPTFYNVGLTSLGGNGALESGASYGMAFPPIDSKDKTYVHTQNSAASSWTIHHNLGKRPSVTVTTAATSAQVIGEVTYINNNTLAVSFEASFNGIAYLN